MAKNYSAKLSLKDAGMIATLKKAVAETEKLKKNLQQINKTPVKIEAKVGSSFKNVQSQINKVAPKSKTINFTAKEDITRTISQVERSVFEMNRNIATSMSGFSSSINASFGALPNTIGNAMRALNNLNNMNTVGTMMGGANGLLPSVFTGAAAGSLVAGARRTGNQVVTALAGDRTARRAAENKAQATANKMVGFFKKTMPKIGGIAEDAMNSVFKKIGNPWTMGDLQRENGPQFRPMTQYEKMIDRQYAKLEKLDAKMRNLGVNRSGQLQLAGRIGVPDLSGSDTETKRMMVADGAFRQFKQISAHLGQIKKEFFIAFGKIERVIAKALTNPIATARSLFSKLFSQIAVSASRAFSTIAGTIKTTLFSSLFGVRDRASSIFNSIKNTGTRAMSSIRQSVIGISAGILRLPSFMQGAAQSMLSSMVGFVQSSNRLVQSIGLNLKRVWTGTQMVAHRVWFGIQRVAYTATYSMFKGVFRITKAFSMLGFNAKRTWTLLKVGANKTFEQISTSGASKFARLTMYIGRSFNRTFGAVGRGFKRMFTKTVTDSNGATRTIQRGWVTMASSIARSIGSSIGGAFTKLQSMGMGAAKAIGAAFTAAIGIGIKGMADRERNLISMRHFLKVGDAKKNGKRTKDDGQINKEADNYMGDLTNFANATPFDTFEVYNAGRRGLQISDGNAKKALDVTKLAGDMAA